MACDRLFHQEQEMMEHWGLTRLSTVTLSDYCTFPIFPKPPEYVMYTRNIILFCEGIISLGSEYEVYDWHEWDLVTVCPWENIIEIQGTQGNNLERTIEEDQIRAWHPSLADPDLCLPYIHLEQGNIAMIIEGRPYSDRSSKGRQKTRDAIHKNIQKIKKKMQYPVRKPVYMRIEIFMNDTQNLPDIDRLTLPIMDAFKGVVYEDDKQVKELQPRIFNVSEIFTKLECRTEPMDVYTIQKIPAGSLFPLSKRGKDYYVIRILY